MNAPAAQRLTSLDAFRGFAIAGMVLVNNPGSWKHAYAPLLHAPWNGWTFTDWVFPFFLFAVGVSMAISLDGAAARGASRGALLAKMARRTAVIFAIGLLLNAIPHFEWQRLRIPGVLQRIALASLAAAPLVLWLRTRGLVAALAVLLLVYTAAMWWVPVPDAAGVVAAGALEPGRDFGAWLDRTLLGSHLWRSSKTWDPEGLWSTLPAVGSVLLGVLAGRWLARPPAGTEGAPAAALAHSTGLLLAGLALLLAGHAADVLWMPVNKSLWTPSYVLLMGGFSLLVFGALHALLDAWPDAAMRGAWRRVLQPLVVFGMNALAIFVLSGLVAKLMATWKPDGTRTLKSLLYAPIEALPLAPADASLLWALLFIAAMYAVAWGMWRKRWFIKA